MWPDLPMPVTTTRPRHSNSARAAARNDAAEASFERTDRRCFGREHIASERKHALRIDAHSRHRSRLLGSAWTCGQSIAERSTGRLGRCATFASRLRRVHGPPMPQTLQLILLLLACGSRAWSSPAVCCGSRRSSAISSLALQSARMRSAWVPDNADVRDLAEFGIVVPDVLDRPRVQPAAAEGDAPRGVRTRASRR